MSHSPNLTRISSKNDGKRKELRNPRETQASRKKVQNRIAQRVFREKQAAYVNRLESLIETYQSCNELQDEESRYNELHGRYLKLLDEHQQLKDALFLFKKKLMTASNQIIAATSECSFCVVTQWIKENCSVLIREDDEIFDTTSKSISDPSKDDHAIRQAAPNILSSILDQTLDVPDDIPPSDLPGISDNLDPFFQTVELSTLESTDLQMELGAEDAYNYHQPSLISSTTSTVVPMGDTFSDTSLTAAGSFRGIIPFGFSTLPSNLYQAPLLVELSAPVTVKSANILAEKILAWCRKTSVRLVSGNSYTSRSFKERGGFTSESTSPEWQIQSLNGLAFAAVDLIASLGRLQQHFRDTVTSHPLA